MFGNFAFVGIVGGLVGVWVLFGVLLLLSLPYLGLGLGKCSACLHFLGCCNLVFWSLRWVLCLRVRVLVWSC